MSYTSRRSGDNRGNSGETNTSRNIYRNPQTSESGFINYNDFIGQVDRARRLGEQRPSNAGSSTQSSRISRAVSCFDVPGTPTNLKPKDRILTKQVFLNWVAFYAPFKYASLANELNNYFHVDLTELSALNKLLRVRASTISFALHQGSDGLIEPVIERGELVINFKKDSEKKQQKAKGERPESLRQYLEPSRLGLRPEISSGDRSAVRQHPESRRPQPSQSVLPTVRQNREPLRSEAEQLIQPLGRPPNYKTKLCFRYERDRYCFKNRACNFAHGDHELRPLPDIRVLKKYFAAQDAVKREQLAKEEELLQKYREREAERNRDSTFTSVVNRKDLNAQSSRTPASTSAASLSQDREAERSHHPASVSAPASIKQQDSEIHLDSAPTVPSQAHEAKRSFKAERSSTPLSSAAFKGDSGAEVNRASACSTPATPDPERKAERSRPSTSPPTHIKKQAEASNASALPSTSSRVREAKQSRSSTSRSGPTLRELYYQKSQQAMPSTKPASAYGTMQEYADFFVAFQEKSGVDLVFFLVPKLINREFGLPIGHLIEDEVAAYEFVEDVVRHSNSKLRLVFKNDLGFMTASQDEPDYVLLPIIECDAFKKAVDHVLLTTPASEIKKYDYGQTIQEKKDIIIKLREERRQKQNESMTKKAETD